MNAFKYKLQYYLTSFSQQFCKEEIVISISALGLPESHRVWRSFPQIVYWDVKSGPYSSKDHALSMILLGLSGETQIETLK